MAHLKPDPTNLDVLGLRRSAMTVSKKRWDEPLTSSNQHSTKHYTARITEPVFVLTCRCLCRWTQFPPGSSFVPLQLCQRGNQQHWRTETASHPRSFHFQNHTLWILGVWYVTRKEPDFRGYSSVSDHFVFFLFIYFHRSIDSCRRHQLITFAVRRLVIMSHPCIDFHSLTVVACCSPRLCQDEAGYGGGL